MMKKKAISTRRPEDYLQEPYSRILIPEEDGGYSAEVLEFPGCYSSGDTAEEALANLEEAAKSWIEASLEQGHDIPAATGHNAYSGKIALRLPAGLHKEAVRLAARDGVSLNQFLVNAIAAKVGAANYHNALLRKLDNSLTGQSVTRETRADHRLYVKIIFRDERLPVAGVQWEEEATNSTRQEMPRWQM